MPSTVLLSPGCVETPTYQPFIENCLTLSLSNCSTATYLVDLLLTHLGSSLCRAQMRYAHDDGQDIFRMSPRVYQSELAHDQCQVVRILVESIELYQLYLKRK